jgi:hypothetical protein
MSTVRLFAALALAAVASLGACSSDQASPPDAAMDLGPSDGPVTCAEDASHCLIIDDAGVSHGCNTGGMGPGDRDDGGGMVAPPPDAAADAMNQPFGAECLSNDQCTSGICFLYRVKGQFCTQFCACNADCPAPPASLGCSGQGVCRVGM